MSTPPLSPLDEAGIAQAVAQAEADFQAASSVSDLKAARNRHLGDQGPIVLANRAIKSLEPSQKAQAGKNLGRAKAALRTVFDQCEEALKQREQAQRLEAEVLDVTVPVQRENTGARHPLETLIEELGDFFVSMGWEIAEGPEVEHEWFNFDALNIPADHPARQEQDTLYVDGTSLGGEASQTGHLVLRTHTSPVQARVMLERDVPIYIVCPGKVFRADELDQTHTPVFHQIEGLAVDKGLTMADLKGTLDHFARSMFGKEAKTRLRPSFFPFTEPSAEMDLWFPQKKGGAGWVEWGGCGMVNPNVLRACGVDPEVYSGFAFGMGIERTLMLRHGIADMHDIVEGDIRFSTQFGTTGRGL